MPKAALARPLPTRQTRQKGRLNFLYPADSLVLMDEIGRGTSTYDGLALADAVARHLATANRCWTLFATHYFELTALAEPGSGIANVHLDAV